MGRRVLPALLAALTIGVGGYPAMAEPAADPGVVTSVPPSADGSTLERVEVKDARSLRLQVRSAAMNKLIAVDVLRPSDTSVPRPTLYLLHGGGGGVDNATWRQNTDALSFLGDKNINVVQPLGGAWSFYTDWIAPDPVLGVNKWQTFLNEELPPLIDAALGTNKVNAIAGLSMAGASVLNLAIAKPELYRSAAVYSGIYQTSDPIGQRLVKAVVETYGDGDVTNMWGPVGGPLWSANDPMLNAEKLRGINLFASTGTGIPGVYDLPGGKFRMEAPEDTPKTVALGGVIEAGVGVMTLNLNNRLNQLGIPATFVYRPTGTHSWGYWQDDLHSSWPVLAKGLFSAP
ncbi:alpha/beta hydrolase [Nocardia sp. NPDC052566]|uniref:alpha/beta hydrolase n=1 Tax=Nocardia sp. NPDC052566 TaxID=3364330 RepID=UPI0037CB3EAD